MSAGVRVAAFLLLAALLPAGGCNFAPLALLLGPRQIQKAEVKLTNGRLLILAETARPDQENPVFLGALHDKLVEILRTNKVPSQIVPPAELARLRQENPDFGRWSVARIGRELAAEEVLYIRIEQLAIRPTPDHPLIEPQVRLRLKLIAVHGDAREARRWPPKEEREGRLVEARRPPREASDATLLDSEAAAFGREVAYQVAMPFYDVDLEEKTPREP